MPNVILTPKQISNASLAALNHQTVLAGTTWRDAEADFQGKVGDTITVRTETTVGTARVFNRAANTPIVIDDLTEKSVDVKLTTYLYKGVALPDEQLTLQIDDFTRRVATPQAKSVAIGVETMVAANMSALTGSLTVKADGSDVHAQMIGARKRLNKNGVPVEDRYFAVSARTPYTAGEPGRHLQQSTLPVTYLNGTAGEPFPWEATPVPAPPADGGQPA